MLEFTLAYVETSICMNAGGIRESQVRELFSPSIRNNARKTSAAHGGMTCRSF